MKAFLTKSPEMLKFNDGNKFTWALNSTITVNNSTYKNK